MVKICHVLIVIQYDVKLTSNDIKMTLFRLSVLLGHTSPRQCIPSVCDWFTVCVLRKNYSPPFSALHSNPWIGIQSEKNPALAQRCGTPCVQVSRTPRVCLIRAFRYRDARRVCVTWPARRQRARPSITTGFIGSIIPILGYVRRPARKYVCS